MKAVNITDEECERYDITREEADQIVNVLSALLMKCINKS